MKNGIYIVTIITEDNKRIELHFDLEDIYRLINELINREKPYDIIYDCNSEQEKDISINTDDIDYLESIL